jgi:hypothetical protein
MSYTRPVSTDQIAYLKALVAEREPNEHLAAALDRARQQAVAGTLTSALASSLIDALKQSPRKQQAETTTARYTATEGMHVLDGVTFKVQAAKNGSGNLYAKVLIERTPGQWAFEYAPGAIARLSEATKMSAEAAATFGALYGICCSCGKDLTDEHSIHNGYGRTCAANNGWAFAKAPAVKVGA